MAFVSRIEERSPEFWGMKRRRVVRDPLATRSMFPGDSRQVTPKGGEAGQLANSGRWRRCRRDITRSVMSTLRLGLVVGVMVWTVPLPAGEPGRTVDFSRDIRPVLSDACFTCHGPHADSREADLRFDNKKDAFADLGGYHAIVPGKPDESELYLRISDESGGMPPRRAPRQLTAEEIETFRLWIEQGAVWQEHWSFVRPTRPELPEVSDPAWCRNPVDRFVLARLDKEGLEPSPRSDKATLIRRVTLDLTGLAPTLDEVTAFLSDDTPGAYERLVDRLLGSPRYGEQMTRYWLDVARYGDTHGLHLDNERSIWPYRDWLIGAFNSNMPFDQFTVEQLAGDLLPEAKRSQRVATGFNRCNVTTSEGGAIDEEFRVRYAVDRVETTSAAWLGLTMGCAACHDHKFDPISQKEFYQLFAFFGSAAEKPMDGNAILPPPVVQLPTAEQEESRKAIAGRISASDAAIKAELAKIEYQDPLAGKEAQALEPGEYVWIDDAVPAGATPSGDGPDAWQFVAGPEHPVHSGGKSARRTSKGRSQHLFTGAKPEMVVGKGDVLFAHVYIDPADPPKEIMLQFNDGSWEHRAFWGEDVIDWGTPDTPSRRAMGPLPEAGSWQRLEVPANKVGLAPGRKINGWAFTQHDGTVYWDTAGIVTRTPQAGRGFESLLAWQKLNQDGKDASLPGPVIEALKVEATKRNEEQTRRLREHFLEHVCSTTRGIFVPLHQSRDAAKKELEALEKGIASTLVMADKPEMQKTFLLERGAYDKPGEEVSPGVLAVLPPMAKEAPRNRLGLARWLVDPVNPLPARVVVNRYWQHCFGTGLVKTADDFGAQGEWPSHPRLLDWLAVEFVESGWDIKAFQRLLVTSATYCQDSRIGAEGHQRDPHNRLLARGPRYRLDAEVVRDNALAISGLLFEKVGGPSVKPYQPAGLWEAVGYTSSNTAKFKQDSGNGLYRRSMYTFWKRTSPPPTMLLLDAPSRETCTVHRSRTNTPLAALALLNDIQFFEAARHLAERMMKEVSGGAEDRVKYAFRLATARSPQADEVAALVGQYEAHLAEFRNNAESALKIADAGDSARDESLDVAELAAWTMVAGVLLNLDETLTKH